MSKHRQELDKMTRLELVRLLDTVIGLQPEPGKLLDTQDDPPEEHMLREARREMAAGQNCLEWAEEARMFQEAGEGELAVRLYQAVVEETLPNLDRHGVRYQPALQAAALGLMASADSRVGDRARILDTLSNCLRAS